MNKLLTLDLMNRKRPLLTIVRKLYDTADGWEFRRYIWINSCNIQKSLFYIGF